MRKKVNDRIYNRVSEIEKEKDYINKLNKLKTEIEIETESKLTRQINIEKEYFIESAIKKSESVIKGQTIEHFAPFILDNWINPDEVVFVGSPIDLISFTDIDSSDNIKIEFLEIKTGRSYLSKKQKNIKEAIDNNRVFFKTVILE